MKKFVSLLLAFSLALCLAACGGSASSAVSGSAASSEAASSEVASSEAAQELSTTDALRIAGLKGPTTMGLVNLLSMEADGTAAMDYDLQLYGAADEIVPLLMKGELDMAAANPGRDPVPENQRRHPGRGCEYPGRAVCGGTGRHGAVHG